MLTKRSFSHLEKEICACHLTDTNSHFNFLQGIYGLALSLVPFCHEFVTEDDFFFKVHEERDREKERAKCHDSRLNSAVIDSSSLSPFLIPGRQNKKTQTGFRNFFGGPAKERRKKKRIMRSQERKKLGSSD